MLAECFSPECQSGARIVTWFAVLEADIIYGDIPLVPVASHPLEDDPEVSMSPDVDGSLVPAVALRARLAPHVLHWQSFRVDVDLRGIMC